MYLPQGENATIDQDMFPILPKKFDNSMEYFDMWLKLFLYETYN